MFDSRYFIRAGKWHRFGKVKKRELFYFWRADFWLNAGNFCLFSAGFWQSLLYLRRLRPSLLFSKGGYVAVGPCLAALLLRIPIVLHDSDAVSGMAHALFQRRAAMNLSGFKAADSVPRSRHVGVPVNTVFAEKLSKEDQRRVLAKYDLPESAEFILVTGGGGGARNLNQAVLEIADQLAFKSNIYMIIVAGGTSFEETKEQAAKLKSCHKIRVLEFVDDMPDLMRACLGVVTRAGATILTEISLAQKAAIIVPNPLLPRAHQLHNARIYQRAGAAWLVSDDGERVSHRALKQALAELVNDDHKRIGYERNVAKVALRNASENTLRAVEDVLSEDKPEHPSLNQMVDERHNRRGHLLGQKLKQFLKILVLVLLVAGFLVKIFYVGSIEIRLADESLLINEAGLAALQQDTEEFVDSQPFFQRRFSLNLDDLKDELLSRGYVESVRFNREIISSKIIVDLRPKHVLGSFTTPAERTIVTTDGYAVKGYEHLLEKGNLPLEIKSPKEIAGDQELVLSALDILFLNRMKAYLASEGYRLREARISPQPREIIFRLDGVELDIIALTTRDAVEQGVALVSALQFFGEPSDTSEEESELLEEEGEEVIKPVEYLDIRLIERVIYK